MRKYAVLLPEDQDALRHLIGRARTWGALHFYTGLILSIPRAEERDYVVMCKRPSHRSRRIPVPLQRCTPPR